VPPTSTSETAAEINICELRIMPITVTVGMSANVP